jgi:hypothetical protein
MHLGIRHLDPHQLVEAPILSYFGLTVPLGGNLQHSRRHVGQSESPPDGKPIWGHD